ncbi:hypothetical protein CesoFtcFv8_023860 [Champsocephalus esox]|uniref:Carboxylesterase type B domain-containing protein n=1 Tax=Champsocephalus esox TaxID=159716 RepID=A0AAN8B5M7_9TELE|nr:hypothetical protein CesoFtcFv8_023860 [Champsocephalus esox]
MKVLLTQPFKCPSHWSAWSTGAGFCLKTPADIRKQLTHRQHDEHEESGGHRCVSGDGLCDLSRGGEHRGRFGSGREHPSEGSDARMDVFKGIPFADVPETFMKPKPHPGWDGVLDATAFKDICLQVTVVS